jgi:non-ribosomal peptide synthetase component F
VVVGVPVAGRDLPELEPLIGMFVNMLVLRVRVAGDMTFAALVDATRSAWLATFEHRDMPFQKLVEALALPRDPGVPPIYQLGFNHLTTPGFSSTSLTAEDDLMIEVCGDGVRVEYSTALFDADTAALLVGDYVRVLATGLADPDTRVDLLPVFSAARVATPTTPAAGALAAATPKPAYVPPRTAAEELVVQVWAEVLDTDRIGALDDFFDLGGHSLLALRVIARLNAMAGVELPIEVFFADTTVAGVAGGLEAVIAAELDELTDDEALRLVGEE